MARALQLMAAEIDRTQALLGARTLDELGPAHLAPASQPLRQGTAHGPALEPDAPAGTGVMQGDRLAA